MAKQSVTQKDIESGKVGTATPDQMKDKLLRAAKGEQVFDPNGPKVWVDPNTVTK